MTAPKKLYLIVVVALVAGSGVAILLFQKANAPAKHTMPPSGAVQQTVTKTSNTFNKTANSLDDPTSIWVVVNKQRPYGPKSYAPTDLVVPKVPLRVPGSESMQVRSATAEALLQMFTTAKAQGLDLTLSSGYRSYDYQVGLYGGYVSKNGQAAADTFSARPGYSEHQSGLAADIEPSSRKCELELCFADTPEGKWLAANAYNYGFIIRYTADKTAVTGYQYEPWHVRYVGHDLANEMHKQNITTLEEFFGLTASPNY